MLSSKTYSITNQSEMVKMANVLKEFVIAKELYTEIKGKNYIHIEGWQFALQSMGLSPMIKEVKDMSDGKVIKWFVEAEIINLKTREVVSKGFALCSSAESTKKSFDEYAILSMAQTRSIGKASRNLVGWIMKLAGYEGTPSEEMTKVGETVVSGKNTITPPAANQEIIYCHGTRKGGCPDGATITKSGYDLSMKIYKKPLCKKCFDELKKLKK